MSPEDTQAPVFETRARGKLLLSGEYFVLDGAKSLALPVRFGQSFHVEAMKEPARLSWTSRNDDGAAWFLAGYELPGLVPLTFTDKKTAEILASILKACRRQNPDFLAGNQSYKALTQNDFPREWGLGTSSTLIAALSQWAQVNPYPLLFDTMGGSGYDIACAYAEGPILYRLEGRTPEVQAVQFDPPFTDALYFVFLGKKQDSRTGILRYRERAKGNAALIAEISRLTERFLAAASRSELDAIIREHETLISRTLDLPRAKDLYFGDFWGEVKSLGAWGGDFVLATSGRGEAETKAYFVGKGFGTVLSWGEMTGH
jgi:mevalonate kinase